MIMMKIEEEGNSIENKELTFEQFREKFHYYTESFAADVPEESEVVEYNIFMRNYAGKFLHLYREDCMRGRLYPVDDQGNPTIVGLSNRICFEYGYYNSSYCRNPDLQFMYPAITITSLNVLSSLNKSDHSKAKEQLLKSLLKLVIYNDPQKVFSSEELKQFKIEKEGQFEARKNRRIVLKKYYNKQMEKVEEEIVEEKKEEIKPVDIVEEEIVEEKKDKELPSYVQKLLVNHYITPEEDLKSSKIDQRQLYKKALSGPPKREPIDFQLLVCKHENYTNDIIMKGRSAKGKSISVIVKGFEHYFYIQRQEPFKTNKDAAVFLEKLERWYHTMGQYSIRNTTGQLWKRNIYKKKNDTGRHITKWTRLTDRHKTLYGWTPKEQRENVLKVWVDKASYTKSYHEFMESPEYVAKIERDDQKSMVRTFHATMPPDLRYRIDYGIIMGGWCKTNSHVNIRKSQQKLYTDQEIRVPHDRIWCDQGKDDIAPLKILSFDIECAGKQLPGGTTRFPVPRWTADRLGSYIKHTLNITLTDMQEKASKSWRPGEWISFLTKKLQQSDQAKLCETYNVKNVGELIPDFKDTDPAIIIVAVVRNYGVDKELKFSKSYALVYENPDAEPINRSTIDPGSKIWDYSKIELRSFKGETTMLKGIIYLFQSQINQWRCWCNGNITGFQPVARGSIPR